MKFDIAQLTQSLQNNCPCIVFAFLHGSAQQGIVAPGSDVDLAVYLDTEPTLEVYQQISTAAEPIVNNAQVDIGILNNAEPVYRFEALKGKRLFARDLDTYADFFVRTCQEYEEQMISYQRQRRYRNEYRQQG